MSSYAQITIHSRNSKMQKMNNITQHGRLIKGIRLGISMSVDRRNKHKINLGDLEQEDMNQQNQDLKISQQIQINQGRKIIRKDIQNSDQSQRKKNQDIKLDPFFMFQSKIFPAIYFKKTTMRTVLKQFLFPQNCKALPPNDQRSPLIYQIIVNLFNEVTFYIFNLLVSENDITKSYYTFFSDSEVIPFTKCCNTPAYVEMLPNSTGKILCNGKNCPHPILAQFLINYQDSQKIWENITYLSTAPQKDKLMKTQIGKYIKTGKYKNYRLKKIINQTTRQVSQVFNTTQNKLRQGPSIQNVGQFNDMFMTNVAAAKINSIQQKQKQLNEQDINQIISDDDKNVQLLKIKILYMAKRQKSLKKNLAKSIVDDGKVFHKKFQLSEKIDDLLRKTQHSNHNGYLSFPKLIEQMKTKQQKRNKSKSVSRTFGI